MRAPSVWLRGVIGQQKVSPLHTGGWNWAWWHRISATWDLYPQALGSQEGFQEGCDMVTPCFGAISQMQHAEREGRDWSRAGGGQKEAWKPARRCAKGQPGLDINPLTEFTSVWTKPDAEIPKERASHHGGLVMEPLLKFSSICTRAWVQWSSWHQTLQMPHPSQAQAKAAGQGSLLPFETLLPLRTQSQGFLPPGLALWGARAEPLLRLSLLHLLSTFQGS